MKVFAPKYYKSFACIADKCRHSCCIGWEIDVDEEALGKYKSLSHEYGKAIISSIDFSEAPHFRLGARERCPHLDENGLCRIILNLGEDYLCHICREHPRFYNEASGYMEVGLGMACEEACRIILQSDDYGIMEEVGETEGEGCIFDFDSAVVREKIYSVLSDESVSYKERLLKIYSDYFVSPFDVADEEWKEILGNMEYLDESHKALMSDYVSDFYPEERDDCLRRALAYFIYRHCTETDSEEEFSKALGFCLFCERLLAFLVNKQEAKTMEEIIDLARIISEEIEYSEDNTEKILQTMENLF